MKNKSSHNKFESFVRKTVAGFNDAPSDGVWEGLDTQLEQHYHQSPKTLPNWLPFLLFALLSASTAYIYILHQQQTQLQSELQQESTRNTQLQAQFASCQNEKEKAPPVIIEQRSPKEEQVIRAITSPSSPIPTSKVVAPKAKKQRNTSKEYSTEESLIAKTTPVEVFSEKEEPLLPVQDAAITSLADGAALSESSREITDTILYFGAKGTSLNVTFDASPKKIKIKKPKRKIDLVIGLSVNSSNILNRRNLGVLRGTDGGTDLLGALQYRNAPQSKLILGLGYREGSHNLIIDSMTTTSLDFENYPDIQNIDQLQWIEGEWKTLQFNLGIQQTWVSLRFGKRPRLALNLYSRLSLNPSLRFKQKYTYNSFDNTKQTVRPDNSFHLGHLGLELGFNIYDLYQIGVFYNHPIKGRQQQVNFIHLGLQTTIWLDRRAFKRSIESLTF